MSDGERRFRSTVPHYLAGRPAYAKRLSRRVGALIGLLPSHDVLDLGCGPGQLARLFAPMARSVVAMDPEPEMLRAAQEAAGDLPAIRFVPGGSSDLASLSGHFYLVTMGRSFHWMDRPETLRRLDAMIEPGGAIGLFNTDAADVPENAWTEPYREIRRRYSADAAERRQRRGERWWRHEAALLQSPFSSVESCAVFEKRALTAATLLDRVLSMSSTSPERLGDRVTALQSDLEAMVAAAAPDGRLTEVVVSSALVARRPNEVAA